tara:strand:- start:2066 stop:2938 length:873 start_codon:yes stop_codon:yes gene_type:complete
MESINIFCFGFGQVAKNFIKKIQSENFKFNLSATSRDLTKKNEINKIKFISYQFNEKNFDSNLIDSLKKADHILISIPPINGEDLVVKNFSNIIKNSKPKWITYLSATSVYGNHNGEWVDEKSKCLPSSEKGKSRLKAENSWLDLGSKNIPVQIFRLSGIYSNNNNVLTRLKAGKVNLVSKKNHFFSRIHVEDIANILLKSLTNFKSGEIFNISDDKPSSSTEVTLYGAKILNVDIPKKIEVNEIESEMLKSFYKDSKKVSNKKMKIFFNYKLKFPTYEEGLNNIRNDFV